MGRRWSKPWDRIKPSRAVKTENKEGVRPALGGPPVFLCMDQDLFPKQNRRR